SWDVASEPGRSERFADGLREYCYVLYAQSRRVALVEGAVAQPRRLAEEQPESRHHWRAVRGLYGADHGRLPAAQGGGRRVQGERGSDGDRSVRRPGQHGNLQDASGR